MCGHNGGGANLGTIRFRLKRFPLVACLPSAFCAWHAAASESGSLKAVKATHGAAVSLEFGAVQTQQAVGDAAALRRKFAAADSPAGGTAS